LELPANQPYLVICSHCGKEIENVSIADVIVCPFCNNKLENVQAVYRPALKNPLTRKVSAIILILFFAVLIIGVFGLFLVR